LKLWLARARRVVKSQLLRRRERYHAIIHAAAIITITEADAEAAQVIYGLEPGRVHLLRNGINESFFGASSEAWHREFGQQPFVLCVGAIQQRKNQLLLLEVCNQLRLPVVLLGPVLPGEQRYAEQVAAAVKANQTFGGRWLQDLRNEDDLLRAAYGACRLFALLSAAETQPLSVMQAMAARRPVVLLRAPYTQDPLFRALPAVGSTDRQAVGAAIRHAWEQGQPTQLPQDYTWLHVAKRLQAIYESACSQ
jgi:glycosyltransferase involved in cell wall biosynthesis